MVSTLKATAVGIWIDRVIVILQHYLKIQGLEVHIDSNRISIVYENTPHKTFQPHCSPSIGVFSSSLCPVDQSQREEEAMEEDPVQVDQFPAKEVQEQALPSTTGVPNTWITSSSP